MTILWWLTIGNKSVIIVHKLSDFLNVIARRGRNNLVTVHRFQVSGFRF